MTRFAQIVLLGATSVAFSGLASATSACLSTGYTGTSIVGVTCEVGDKIFDFTNFTAPTTSVGLADVTITGPTASPYTAGGFNVIVSDSLGGVLQSGFSLNYTVSIDTTAPGSPTLNYISGFATGILDSSTGTTLASLGATLTGGAGCSAGSNDNNKTISPTGTCAGIHATAPINVVETFSYTTVSDGLSNVSNTFTQAVGSAVPEPTTFVLMGAGLGLIGMLRRKAARR